MLQYLANCILKVARVIDVVRLGTSTPNKLRPLRIQFQQFSDQTFHLQGVTTEGLSNYNAT